MNMLLFTCILQFSKIRLNMLISHYEIIYRNRLDSTRHCLDGASTNGYKSIPFEIIIKLPPPLKTGVDYGFISRKKV